MRRLTTEQIQRAFAKEGYTLLTNKYINNKTKLDYECPKGHKNEMTWDKFRTQHRCPDCAGNKRLTTEQVELLFKDKGYALLSNEYLGVHHKLDCECPNKHKIRMSWNDLQQEHRCMECSGKKKHTIESIGSFFKESGYELLSNKYIHRFQPLQSKCPKGHITLVLWNNFLQRPYCYDCKELVREKELGRILKELFPDHNVRPQDNLDFLGRQRVDYSIRNLCLAFEHDGQQHFEPVRWGGINQQQAQDRLKMQRKWDLRKNRLCKRKGYHLIRIPYYERIDADTIKERLVANGYS